MTPYAALNGEPLDPAFVPLLAATTYGHFSSMQVRGGRVRGLALHIERLDRSSRELFGDGHDPEHVRGLLRGAVQDRTDASVRITALPDRDLLVSVSDPVPPGTTPLHLRSVRYERDLPHLKHTGTFGLRHQYRLAVEAGYDDALFLDRTGRVSEASIWNVCFLDPDGTVVWPDAPALPGITMLLAQAGLHELGVRSEHREVRLEDLRRYDAAYLTNSIDPALPVASIDDTGYPDRPDLRQVLLAAHETQPWDEL
jgi:branched-subunit amino acid aminotransferase/4-amino-4-deoxychorismate lyase